MNWKYKGKEIKGKEDLKDDVVGFVYLIVNKITGERYVGKKILLNKRTKPPLKGYKRRRITYVESNWKTYTGSNSVTKTWGFKDCDRQILHQCINKTMMSYYEVKEQFERGVLESNKYLNDNIQGKWYNDKIQKWL